MESSVTALTRYTRQSPDAGAPFRMTPEGDGQDNYEDQGTDSGSTLSALVSMVEEAEDASIIERTLAERDRDYYDGKQLTAAEEAELALRGQPAVVINRIKRKVNFLKGLEKQNRTKPKGLPRNGEHDQEASEAATDSIRFVCDQNNWDQLRSNVFENILVEGKGACEFEVKYVTDPRTGKMRPKIVLGIVPWDRFVHDPHSRMPDFSDAAYLGSIMWMDRKAAVRKFRDINPDIEAIIEASYIINQAGETYDDRPKMAWVDNRRERVRIVQLWYQSDEGWHWCLFTSGGKIDGGPSPYIDEEGTPVPGILARSGYIDRENRRYGEVRDMVSPQDEVNKRRSKALHLLSMRQIKYTNGAVDDINVTRRELARPDGAVKFNPGATLEILDNQDLAQGQAQLLQEAKNELDLMGPNASMQGKGVGGQSGRAIIAQQQGGVVEASDLLDGLREWSFRVYKMIWWTIKLTWDQEMVVRVTDDEEKAKFVVMNRPVTFQEAAMKRLTQEGVPPEKLQIAQQQLAEHPDRDQIAMHENVPAEIDIDIVLEEVPDVATIQQEEFAQLVQLAPAVPFPPEVYIRASSLRNKEQLIEMLKGSQEQQQMQGAIAAKTMETQLQQLVANVEKTISETMKNMAQAGAASAKAANPSPDGNAPAQGQGSLSPSAVTAPPEGEQAAPTPSQEPAGGPSTSPPQPTPSAPQPGIRLIRGKDGLAMGFEATKADGSVQRGIYQRDLGTGRIIGAQIEDAGGLNSLDGQAA